MAEQVDISDYNYFDVEDFSVDSFFRSLELQSRFTSNDLEFSFPADLDNVPISSCLTSVGFLESSPLKSSNTNSGLSAAEDVRKCGSGLTEDVTEASIADLNDEDDNAAAVDVFFRSLQLRSCLLRTEDETADSSLRCSQDKDNASICAGQLFVHSPHADIPTSGNVEGKTDEKLSSNDRKEFVRPHGSYTGVLPEKSLPKFNYLSSSLTSSGDSECKDHRTVQCLLSSADVRQSQMTITLTSSKHTAHELDSTDSCSGLHETASLADKADDRQYPLCSKKQSEMAITEDNQANGCERRAIKGGKMGCCVCGVTLSDKYSYVRHLLTPLHRRRAEGYCARAPSLSTTNSNHTEDVAQLLSRRKPIQCRVCRFSADDTSSQLLYHLTSSSHYVQAKRKLLQCVPCRFVGTCDDIVTHVKSNSHATLVNQTNRPLVVAACRSSRHHRQVPCRPTKDDKSCSLCGMKSPSTSSLKIHMRRRHTGQRPFRCSVCCKAYCDNSTLTLHYKTARHRANLSQVELYSSTV